MNDSNFVETRGAKYVLECVKVNSCVTITASSGVGKTAILQHVSLKMKHEGYTILPITNPQDIITFHNPSQKAVFVIDDFCGTYSINQSDFDKWKSAIEDIKERIEYEFTKIIVACRLQVYRERKIKSLSIFSTCVCNLLSKDLCLSRAEKQSIADLYLDAKSSEIIQYYDLHDCFPLLCKLYNDNTNINVIDFFQNPFTVYEAEIEKFFENEEYEKYCVLALCVMFDNLLLENWFTEEINKDLSEKINKTCEACRLPIGTPRLVLLDKIKLLEYTFIKKEYGFYRTIHDKMFDFLVAYFGKRMIQCLLRHADSKVISQRFILDKKNNDDQHITVVPHQYHDMYIERLICDWHKGTPSCVFKNINMKPPSFRKKFLNHLEELDISFQEILAHTGGYDKHSVLVQSCHFDCIPLIVWCLTHGPHVNKCSFHGETPLTTAAQEGHIEVVKILLENEAHINKCNNNGISPLGFGCEANHLDVVKILIDNKADIDKCDKYGFTPLIRACRENNIEIVEVLLFNKADPNICSHKGASPLFTASHSNHKEIVKLLLDNKADINKCTNRGLSPLYISCQQNNIDILNVLLNNKADINTCSDKEISPLYIACYKNHKEIVKVLLDNQADIDKCEGNGASALYIACQNNHIEIVKVLLDNKADINKCRTNGVSPLHIACQTNHIEIVKVLLDNKADVNKCSDDGTYPLCMACQTNHIEIVKVLLDNKADINKCKTNGASPLYIACQNNHIEIVKVLLDNKADVNKCLDGETSPLYLACQKNHIEIVKVLLDNKADINKCRTNGASPLHIACQTNRKEIVKALLDNKADINKCSDNGVSPLYAACKMHHIQIVKILLDNTADINNCRVKRKSPFHCV